MTKLPLARSNDIVVQEAGDELLVYDMSTYKAFNLNQTSRLVFQACDGRTTFAELKAKHHFTDDLIFLAIDELKRVDLLAPDETYQSPHVGVSRREVMRKIGVASVIALPIIASIIAPPAASAASGATCADNIKNGQETDIDCGGPACPPCANGKTCLQPGDCASGLCSGGTCVSCLPFGGVCTTNGQCCNGTCAFGTCN